MKINELKDAIVNNELSNDLLILTYDDNTWLANQYVNAICEVRAQNLDLADEEELGYEIVEISSLLESSRDSIALISNVNSNLNILRVETFDETSPDYSQLKNVVVICKKIDKKIEKFVQDYVVKMPKLLDWQIKDYLKTECPGLDGDDVEWLYQATAGDIYRILNEVDKIKLFAQNERSSILSELRLANGSDLYNMPIFDFTNAIVDCDKIKIADYMRHRKACPFEPMNIIGILLKTYNNILFATQNSKANFESLGMSSKQAYFLSKKYAGYSAAKLKKMITFLSSLDARLKSGELDMSQDSLLDYVVCTALN